MCRSLKIIFIVFILLVYSSKNNTDYALRVHLYSLIKVNDLRPSCTQIGHRMIGDRPCSYLLPHTKITVQSGIGGEEMVFY